MILEDSQIKDRLQSDITDLNHPDSLSVDPIIDLETQLQPASLDVRIGGEIEPESDLMIVEDHDPFCTYGKKPEDVRPCPHEDGEWHIPPRSFLLGSSYEQVKIPYDLVSRVEGRSTSGRSGLIIHATAGFIDPGFVGDITYEIFNFRNATMKLPFRQRIGQLVFYELGSRPDNPYGQGNNKYQNQSGVTFAKSDES